MDKVEAFIEELNDNEREIALQLHEYLLQQPGVYTRLSYKIPFYYRNSWVCYLNPLKKGGIEFCFTRGNELSSHPILESRDRKQIRGVSLLNPGEIEFEQIELIIQEALMLDEQKKYGSKQNKN